MRSAMATYSRYCDNAQGPIIVRTTLPKSRLPIADRARAATRRMWGAIVLTRMLEPARCELSWLTAVRPQMRHGQLGRENPALWSLHPAY